MTALEMNPDIRARWVDALRGGEFTQDTGQLVSDRGHCCLGVLCELAVEEGVTRRLELGVFGDPKEDYSDSLLPQQVQVWAGLQYAGPMTADRWRLDDLNDVFKFSFAEIADVIEGVRTASALLREKGLA